MTDPILEYSCSEKFEQTTIEIMQSFIESGKTATFRFNIPANSTSGETKGTILSQSSSKYTDTDIASNNADSAQITNGDTTIELIGISGNIYPVFQWRADYRCYCDYSNINVITQGSYGVTKWAGKFTLFKDTSDEHIIDFSEDRTVFSGMTGAGETYNYFADTISDTIAEKISMLGGMSPITGVTEKYKNATANIDYTASNVSYSQIKQIYQSKNILPYYFDEIACPEITIRLKSSASGTEQLWAPASTQMDLTIMYNYNYSN